VTDFIDEIKEDLEREKYAKLWGKYGHFFIIAGILAVIITAANIWWNNSTSAKQQAAGNSFYKALSIAPHDAQKATALFDELKQKNTKGFSALAGIKEAELLVKQGQTDKALSVYKEIAENNKNDRAIQDLASLLSVNLRISSGKSDKNDDVILQTLVDKKSPWYYSALELQGLRYLSVDNKKAAKDSFAILAKDPLTPTDLHTRAKQILAIIGETGSETIPTPNELKK